MKLSIITINYNNAEGLRKTLESVAAQTYRDFEHVIVDGASTDSSLQIIKEYVNNNNINEKPIAIKWVSEPDNGIYNAMNKGIRMAEGQYCQFLNSGDMLAADNVVEKMLEYLETNTFPDILYGDMQKVMPNGKKLRDKHGNVKDVTLNMFYHGCLNHSPAYIRKSLFESYGMYDENLKICSDWKFYMQSIVLGQASVKYVPLLVTIFDMGGISETRKDILEDERKMLLQQMVPQGILKDYERYHFPMSQYNRLKRYHLWGLVSFVERVLFKFEKWGILK